MKKIILSMVLAIPLYMLSMVISNTASAKYKDGYSRLEGKCVAEDWREGFIKVAYDISRNYPNCMSKEKLFLGLKWVCSRTPGVKPFTFTFDWIHYDIVRPEKLLKPCRYW